MKSRVIGGLLCLLVVAAAAQAEEGTRLLRFPDIHSDQVVFSYGGDLWLASTDGGMARRLTAHPGQELFARFSPDGQWIAFTGQYDGDEQVYVVPTSGGEPIRLTWYPAVGPLPPRWGYDNQVYGWTPDGAKVLFRSLREKGGAVENKLYTVSRTGGLPQGFLFSGLQVKDDDVGPGGAQRAVDQPAAVAQELRLVVVALAIGEPLRGADALAVDGKQEDIGGKHLGVCHGTRSQDQAGQHGLGSDHGRTPMGSVGAVYRIRGTASTDVSLGRHGTGKTGGKTAMG